MTLRCVLQRIARASSACGLLALLLLPAVPPAAAAERTLEIRSMHANIVVARSGTVTITERFTVNFIGEWNGLYRVIPVEYHTRHGMNYTLRLEVVSVTDDAGRELRYEVERAGGGRRVKMWVPDARDAVRTIVLTYRAPNALRFFDEHDELYWNITGSDWDFPIQRVTAEVMLPEDVTGVRTAAFTGTAGSTESVIVQQNGAVVSLGSTRPVGFGEDLTVVVGWNPGIVTRPTPTDRALSLLASNAILLLPVFAFLAMFGLWQRFGRDPEPGSVYVRYEPPADVTPAEAGTLMDDRVDMRDITATLVDLAVRGYIEITEVEQDHLFGLVSSRDYELTLLRAEQWPQLKAHERALLQALSVHSTDDRVRFSDLQNQFYKHLPEIRKHLSRSLTDGGYYRAHPALVRTIWIIGGAVLMAIIILGGSALYDRLGMSPLAAVIAGVITFVIIAVFGWLMPRRTTEGARMHESLCGFEEFLSRVEKDRLERMTSSPALFEKYLPFAMAFGVEKNWARAFEGLASEPPRWYHSSDQRAFRPGLFAADLGRLSGAAGSAMSSAPRSSSSSSSGSSGFSGGFSGGGFGGGGGGGF